MFQELENATKYVEINLKFCKLYFHGAKSIKLIWIINKIILRVKQYKNVFRIVFNAADPTTI